MKEEIRYRIYDCKTKQTIGTFNAKNVSEHLGIKTKRVSDYARTRSKVKGRYIVEKVEEKTIGDMKREWDEIRLKLLGKRKEQKGDTES